MPSIQKQLEGMSHVEHVDDELEIGNGIIITLRSNWCFRADPGCGVRGFDTWTDALAECRRNSVYRDATKA